MLAMSEKKFAVNNRRRRRKTGFSVICYETIKESALTVMQARVP